MIERFNVFPENMYRFGANNKLIYTPVVVVKTGDHATIHISGRTARLPDGGVAGRDGDMRVQLRRTCENIKIALESVGATFADVTRTVTYVTDMKAYFEAIDERWKFFKEPLPTSTVLGVSCLGVAEMLVEIEVEAAIDSARLRIPKQ